MSKMELMKTAVPDLYSKALADKQYIFQAAYADYIPWITFAAVGDILRENKSKEKPAAFVLRDGTGQIIVAAIVEFVPSEDPTKPEGNWRYYWTFDAADVTEGMIICELSNEVNQIPFVTRAGNKYGMEYLPGRIVMMHSFFFDILKEWLAQNAKEGEDTEIEMKNVFSARSTIEDGELVMSIEPMGKMVQLIKGDVDLSED